jgi:hypothetical protein
MPFPQDAKLYANVKAEADRKFLAPTSAYKSAWIVQEYKRRGGLYGEDGKERGLTRWFEEKWVHLERPIKDKKGRIRGYEDCGRQEGSFDSKDAYPVCRPSRRVSDDTPVTLQEIPKKVRDKVKKEKQKGTYQVRVRFTKS